MSAPDGFSEYLRFLVSRRGRRARFLRYTIYLYLGSVFLFAGFYFLLFRHNPVTFAFAADILSAQATTLKLETRRDSVTTEQHIGLLQILVDTLARTARNTPLSSRATVTGREALFQLGSREYSVTRSVRDSTGGGAIESPGEVEVRQEGGSLLARMELPGGKLDFTPENAGELQDQAQRLIKFLRGQLALSHDLVMRLPTAVRPNWGYVDFVYFSAITQLTVGYGDILPNTTLVRVLVIIQSLVAVVMLVVVINLVLTGGGQPTSGEMPVVRPKERPRT
ncbi:MAG TPA: potassium channel family protein [Gemmatimonadales bacterium]|nr:potassium channel family protein [Gemmatimonadales bacterium]